MRHERPIRFFRMFMVLVLQSALCFSVRADFSFEFNITDPEKGTAVQPIAETTNEPQPGFELREELTQDFLMNTSPLSEPQESQESQQRNLRVSETSLFPIPLINDGKDQADSRTITVSFHSLLHVIGTFSGYEAAYSINSSKFEDYSSFESVPESNQQKELRLPEWDLGPNYVNVLIRNRTTGETYHYWEAISYQLPREAVRAEMDQISLKIDDGSPQTAFRDVEITFEGMEDPSRYDIRYAVNSILPTRYSDEEKFTGSMWIKLPDWASSMNYVNVFLRDRQTGIVRHYWQTIRYCPLELVLNQGETMTWKREIPLRFSFDKEDDLSDYEFSYSVNSRDPQKYSSWKTLTPDAAILLDNWYDRQSYVNVILRDKATGKQLFFWKKITLFHDFDFSYEIHYGPFVFADPSIDSKNKGSDPNGARLW